MARARAALRLKEIVPAVVLEQVWPLRRTPVTAVVQKRGVGQPLRPGFVNLEDPRAPVQQHVVPAVVVMEDAGVDAVLLEEHRLGIGALGPIRRDHHLPAADGAHVVQAQGGADVISPVAVGNVRRPVAPAALQALQVRPGGVGDGMADHFPVDQIPAVADGNAGEEDERGVHHVIILAHAENGGIREEPPPDRVVIAFLPGEANCRGKVAFQRPMAHAVGDIKGRDQAVVAPQRIHAAPLHQVSALVHAAGHGGIVEQIPAHGVHGIQIHPQPVFYQVAQHVRTALPGRQERQGYAVLPRPVHERGLQRQLPLQRVQVVPQDGLPQRRAGHG